MVVSKETHAATAMNGRVVSVTSLHSRSPQPNRRPPITPPIRVLLFFVAVLSAILGLALQSRQAVAQGPTPTGQIEFTLQEILVPQGGELKRAIHRLIPLRAGDRVDETTLGRLRESLSASPILDEVQVYTARGDVAGSIHLRRPA